MKQDAAPTLRTLSSAACVTELTAQQTALLVIDIQNEYFEGRLPIPHGPRVLAQSRKLVDFAHQHRIPVFFIRHEGAEDGPIFARGSRQAEFHPDLLPADGDVTVVKATPSAFVGTDLDARLKQRGISQLILVGLMTHMCVSTTARDALPAGYQTMIVEDATATRDLDTWDAGRVDSEVLHRAALAGVADVFAEIKTTHQVLALPVIG